MKSLNICKSRAQTGVGRFRLYLLVLALFGLVPVSAIAAVAQVINVASVVADNVDPDTNSNSASVTTTIVTTIVTTTSPGGGEIRASFVTADPGCSFTSAQTVPVVGGGVSIPSSSVPVGVSFLHGLLAFTVSGCTLPGATLDVTITYPQPLPAGSQLWKYGPTVQNNTPHWYVLAATIGGNTVNFSVTDGGHGDSDLVANGTIIDPVGPGAMLAVAPVPTLSEWLLVLLSLLVLGVGVRAARAGKLFA